VTNANDAYVTVDGQPVPWLRVTVGYTGPWQAEAHVSTPDALGTPCTIKLGPLTLTGTPLAAMDGTYAEQRRTRIVGGAGAWGVQVPAAGYHNDAGIKARLIADDVARTIGETIGTFIPAAERIGVDYARPAGTASSVLTAIIGNAAWWVDYAGTTHVGPRPVTTVDPDLYTVLSYDPAERTATLQVDNPADIPVGATIAEGLDVPGVVRELEIIASGTEALRVNVWLGGTAQDGARLAGLLAAITRRVAEDRLYGVYRYRVVSQGTDGRLDLQAVQQAAGLPDLRAITVWPGTSGTWAKVTPGSESLVMFVAGDRAQPLVMALGPYGQGGFAPVELTLGGPDGPYAARVGDAVTLPEGMTFTATIGGASTACTVTAWGGTGSISSGSLKVKIA
jgi:hypothetical protein